MNQLELIPNTDTIYESVNDSNKVKVRINSGTGFFISSLVHRDGIESKIDSGNPHLHDSSFKPTDFEIDLRNDLELNENQIIRYIGFKAVGTGVTCIEYTLIQ